MDAIKACQIVHPHKIPCVSHKYSVETVSELERFKILKNYFLIYHSSIPIFRYDVRLYLSSLDEFDERRIEEIKCKKMAEQNGDSDEEEDTTEKLEEELCDEERYADMYLDMKKREEG